MGVLPVEPGEASSLGLELAFRRVTARNLRLIARWLGPRTDLLRILFEDEDRRSIRALVRGAAAGVAAESRLAGLIPTPSLPERLLEELARQPRVRDLAALLVLWGHPYGPPLQAAAGTGTPDLFRLECVLNQTFARRATKGARGGGQALRAYVEETLDLENLRSALMLVVNELEQSADAVFLPGGRRITIDRFRAAVKAGSFPAAASLLAEGFGVSEVARLVRRLATAPLDLEAALLLYRIRSLRDQARRDPLGPAPLLWYLLRLRAQIVNLSFLQWGAALGLPPALRRARLAEVA
jgi:vacuolar-type H+-ATPase subunit C/Vma6